MLDLLAAFWWSPDAAVFFYLSATLGALMSAAGLWRLYGRR